MQLIRGFHNINKNSTKLISLWIIIKLIIVMRNIEILEAITAPNALNLGIKAILIMKLDNAPIETEKINSFSFFTDNKYCQPIILFTPRKNTVGDNAIINFSIPINSDPKNHTEKLLETEIIPAIIKKVITNVNLNDSFK